MKSPNCKRPSRTFSRRFLSRRPSRLPLPHRKAPRQRHRRRRGAERLPLYKGKRQDRSKWERTMTDPLSGEERYRSDAVRLFELAEGAPNPFFRDYYNGLAKRYLMHAENQEKVVSTSDRSATTEVIPDSPDIQAAPESSPEEVALSVGPAPPTPLQPAQSPAGAPKRSRHRRPAGRQPRPSKATSSKAPPLWRRD